MTLRILPFLLPVTALSAKCPTQAAFRVAMGHSARQTMDQRFPNADQSGKWNDGAGAPVEITGIGFFDRPHGQVGRAPNNIEIHPILSIQFLGQPTPATSLTPTSTAQPSPTGNQWEYQMISAENTTDLLNQANTQGTRGWEL